MANSEIKEIYDTIQKYVESDTDLTDDYMNRLNRHFYSYIKNPSDKKEETFKRLRDALIIAWLADLFGQLKRQVITQWKSGVSVAKTSLSNAKFKTIVSKTLTQDKIKEMIQANLDKSMTEIAYVSDAIKVNSDRAIADIKSNIDKTKKAISTELMSEFEKYGVAYFVDSAGRRQSITNYINKKSFDMVSSSFRNAFVAELFRNGIKFVRVQRFPSNAIECNLCINYDEKILSIKDGVSGFESIMDAKKNGLWHFYCQHYVIPVIGDFAEEEHTVIHTKENDKFRERNIRKGF